MKRNERDKYIGIYCYWNKDNCIRTIQVRIHKSLFFIKIIVAINHSGLQLLICFASNSSAVRSWLDMEKQLGKLVAQLLCIKTRQVS